MSTLTVDADLVLTCNQDYLAMQGEESTVSVAIDASLIVAGQYAYVDLYLPNGSIVQKGEYDYSSSFDVELGADDIALDYDGVLYIKVVLATISGSTRTEVSSTNKLKSRLLSSILAEIGEPVAYSVDEYVYWATNEVSTEYGMIRKMDTSDLSVAESLHDTDRAYGIPIICTDDDYVYVSYVHDSFYEEYPGLAGVQYGILKLTKDLVYVSYYAIPQVAAVTDMVDDDDYLYVSTMYLSTNIHKIQKSDMTVVDTQVVSIVTTTECMCIGTDYLYIIGTTQKTILKVRLSDLTLVDEYSSLAYTPQSIAVDDDYVYVATTSRLYKLDINDLTNILILKTTTGYFRTMVVHEGYLYGDSSLRKMQKRDVATLTLQLSSATFPTNVSYYYQKILSGVYYTIAFNTITLKAKINSVSLTTLEVVAQSDEFDCFLPFMAR